MKSILIVGCGSIGARHARNAHSLGYDVLLMDPDPARVDAVGDEIHTTKRFTKLEAALEAERPDAVLIASPSSSHIEQARSIISLGIPVCIEKPLATSTEGLEQLLQLVEEEQVVTMMAQSFRFHETFIKLKSLLTEGILGTVYHAHFTGGQYLPDWHKDTDYRTEYMARQDQGGGVMFTSKSHTLDFVEWLFGDVHEYTGFKDRLGSLEIDVDDACFLLMKTVNGVVVYAAFDFLERPHRSVATIVGEKGRIEANFIEHTILVIGIDGMQESVVLSPDINQRYIAELQHFVTLVDTKTVSHELDIVHGKHIVDLMLDPRVRDIS